MSRLFQLAGRLTQLNSRSRRTRCASTPIPPACPASSTRSPMTCRRPSASTAALFGWEFVGPGQTPGDPPGEYFVARVSGVDVAGLGAPRRRGAAAAAGLEHPRRGLQRRRGGRRRPRRRRHDRHRAVRRRRPPGGWRWSPIRRAPSLCLWQAGQRQGAALVNAPSAWAMSLLTTPDPERRAGVLRRGVRLAGRGLPGRRPGRLAVPPARIRRRRARAAGPPRRGGGDDGRRPDAGATAAWGVDFWIADAERAASVAPELGGTVIAAPHDAPPFRRAVLAAPDGATFSVSELRLPG